MSNLKRLRCRGPLASPLVVAVLGLTAPLGCSGGSSQGSIAYDSQAMLADVVFPDPLGQNQEGIRTPPQDAPLNQQIVFQFTGHPDPSQVNSQRIRVLDPANANVPGTLLVQGKRIVWTAALPTQDPVKISGNQFQTGGAGLVPGTRYTVRVGPDSWPEFITQVAAPLQTSFPDPTGGRDVVFQFTATNTFQKLLKGMAKVGPRLTSSDPPPGATDVSPDLYTDPAGLFPPRGPFTLTFDGPVHPSMGNLGRIALVDLDDTSGGPGGLSLGVVPTILVNRPDLCVLQVMPGGILPLGHLLSLEIPADLRGLSQNPVAGPDRVVAATFTTSADPSGRIPDLLLEDFDSDLREELDPSQLQVGQLPADWDEGNSNVLTAAFPFVGSGILGRFQPLAPPKGQTTVIVLDTSTQTFPLMDGSTPDAPPGYVVTGGVFPFSSITIPEGIILQTTGPNPLVLSATGDVTIQGDIDLDAAAGTADRAWDSGIVSVPGGAGGAGGGRGGEGHPILYQGVPSKLTLVSPPSGGRGWGPGNLLRIGGLGGQCGMLDQMDAQGRYGTDMEITCGETQNSHNNGFRGAGGGGGSFLKPGSRAPNSGWGNVIVDGFGNYFIRTRQNSGANFNALRQGGPGQLVFVDGDKSNDFIGVQGEIQVLQGGQGGGAGGSATDSWFCGIWCQRDADPDNDAVCGAEFGNPPSLADSVGDSRGGGGGGGGGALKIASLGRITLSGRIDCRGGNGGGGETLGCGTWGGCGAGGSGGAVLLQSAVDVILTGRAVIDVSNGNGEYAITNKGFVTGCSGRLATNQGSGGDGSIGIIQLQAPQGQKANVDGNAVVTPTQSWVDKNNIRNPAPFGDTSIAQSRWYDLGRMTDRGLSGADPVFSFLGTDGSGYVMTDAAGNVLDPDVIDIRCDYLGQLDPRNPGRYLPGESPRADFIPPNTSVRVQFQGADPVAPGALDVDPATVTRWSSSASIADGMQFLRWRITFDLSADDTTVGPTTPHPSVQWIGPRAEF